MIRKMSQAPWTIQACFMIAMLYVLIVLFAPWIAPYDPNETRLLHNNQPPVFLNGSWEHPLGTDQLGRDILSRMLVGLRTSIGVAIFGLLIGCTVGVAAGLVSGYFGGLADRIIMALVDFQFAVPYTLILLMGIVIFGTHTGVLIALIGLANWENYARMIRGLVLSIRSSGYIESAKASGASAFYIIVKHVTPNVLPTVLIMMTIYFPSILTLESSLSFLGIGIQPPTASLGRMVGDGRSHLMTSWWISIIPSLIIVTIAFVMQTIGDWYRDSMQSSILK